MSQYSPRRAIEDKAQTKNRLPQFFGKCQATGYTEPRQKPSKEKNQDKVIIKDMWLAASTAGIESLATLLKACYHDNSPLVNCMLRYRLKTSTVITQKSLTKFFKVPIARTYSVVQNHKTIHTSSQPIQNVSRHEIALPLAFPQLKLN